MAAATDRVEFPDRDIASFVLERAVDFGGKPALVEGASGRAISYVELERATRAFAAGLATRGVGPGETVGIFMPNLPEYAIAFHGTARRGARATTANPLYTARELAHQLGDAAAKLLLTVPPFLSVAGEAAAIAGVEEIFVVGESGGARPLAELLGDPDEVPEAAIDPANDLAALPYSSGTTGLPKGVMLTHANLVANLTQIQDAVPISSHDVLLGVLPFFHIYGQNLIMNQGLWRGATIVTMARFDLEQFLDLVERYRVTRLYVVPPIALALAKHPAVDAHDLSSVELILSGAAPLGAELADQVEERLGCRVVQGYGLTETSPVTHVIRSDAENRPGSIGPALVGTECRLIDPLTETEAAPGEAGELWIRGPQVMAGYLNNPAATAETLDSDGWLRSGDIARVDEDGYYTIVDRLKELIKYKGFQVPPAELEAILIAHPQVADVAVIGVPDEEAGELPKAFVVGSGGTVDADALIDYVAAQVAPQKRIRLVEQIDEIPRSPSGKILRRVLKDRDPAVG
ncbi:MAG TPA: AMP-binding protein [Solirubrobacteraceae bacterium]|nr:AMP-binding protein [Solirubrobacteraceae bacterium]